MEPPANPLHPKVRTLWRIGTGAVALVWVVVWGALGLAVFAPLAALAVLALPLPVAVPNARYRRWRYELRSRDVYLARGVVLHATAVIPFDRIQFVETRQGPLDRFFGLAQVVIYTAGGREGIPGLAPEEAERLREELARVAGTVAV